LRSDESDGYKTARDTSDNDSAEIMHTRPHVEHLRQVPRNVIQKNQATQQAITPYRRRQSEQQT